MKRYDMVVIGGGTAGLVSAVIAAGTGARVALAEPARTGGDCLWTGCVPSKSLIAAAQLAHRMRTADRLGLGTVDPHIDFARVMDRVHAAIAAIAPHDSPERLRAEGVEVIEAAAQFAAPGRIVVGGRELAYRTALIATGSAPMVPPVPGLADAEPLTNETVWGLRELPRRLVVLGGGPIGCELGQAFARLGSQVTLVEMAPRLLMKEERDASALVTEHLSADGVDVRLGAAAVAVRPAGDGHVLLLGDAEKPETVGFDRILVAAGRRPHSAGLALEAAGVQTDERGAVVVDERLRTSARNVYALGDVTGQLPFTHVAAYHARVAAVNALFHARRKVSYDAVPWVTFTDPEVARVGMTEEQARERWGRDAVAVSSPYARLDRAIAAAEAHGFAKLVGDPRGRLVGATIAAPAAGEAIAELTAWIAQGGRIDDVSQTVHAYPTLAEGQSRAADDHVRAKYTRPRIRAVTRTALAALRLADRPR
ncbi:MAG TPA: FAD-dependent oxidoreductase [Solirubrobacteraceae bacterium]|nr:FAD-dependent oxidoreductase [Solirubrobacteraceae bacterium]